MWGLQGLLLANTRWHGDSNMRNDLCASPAPDCCAVQGRPSRPATARRRSCAACGCSAAPGRAVAIVHEAARAGRPGIRRRFARGAEARRCRGSRDSRRVKKRAADTGFGLYLRATAVTFDDTQAHSAVPPRAQSRISCVCPASHLSALHCSDTSCYWQVTRCHGL